jgi:hypothetical protein
MWPLSMLSTLFDVLQQSAVSLTVFFVDELSPIQLDDATI